MWFTYGRDFVRQCTLHKPPWRCARLTCIRSTTAVITCDSPWGGSWWGCVRYTNLNEDAVWWMGCKSREPTANHPECGLIWLWVMCPQRRGSTRGKWKRKCIKTRNILNISIKQGIKECHELGSDDRRIDHGPEKPDDVRRAMIPNLIPSTQAAV